MDQFRKIFGSLSVAQRVGILAAVIFVVAGLTSFARWRRESDFRPLFTGMPPEDAAAIVQKLKESGVDHRLAENGTSVLVRTDKVDEVRLEMAGAGLPRSGRIGFELFDKTNLGVTDFAEHVNYRRALEGELERSVRSLTEVEQARIHISFPKDSVFLDAQEPAKASVLLTLHPGARLNEPNVLAITNLVASAVEGLNPDFVSVVDMRGNLLSRPKKTVSDSSASSSETLDYEHQVEKDLLAKVQATLSPLLGEDHFRAGISADCDFSTSEQTDETFDPTRSVMTTSQKAEDLSSKPEMSGIPGTQSNLPRPTSRPSASGSSVSRRTENVAYETSRSVRSVKIPKGTVKRLSASLLIDQEVHWEGTGAKAKRIVSPPSPEKLKAIHDLVAGAIGLSTQRGDQLIVQSLPFQQSVDNDSPLPNSTKPTTEQDAIKQLMSDRKVQIGVGSCFLLVLGLVAFALTRKGKKTTAAAQTRGALPEPAGNTKADELSGKTSEEARLNGQSQVALQLPEVPSKVEGLRTNARDSVTKDPAVAAGVIRGWMLEEAN